MAENSEYSFPFDSVEVDGKPDREYLADAFAEYFRAFISSGIFMKESTNLQVIANGDMTVTLKPGRMIIDGYRYSNVSDILVSLSPADGIMNRIDRVSVTWSAEDRDIHYTLQKGIPAYRPAPPVCRRDAEYKDYVVADIYVAAGAISIRQADITDQRLNSTVCGLAFPFYDLDTATLYDQLNDFYKEFVDKSNTSYDEFVNIAQTAYNDLTKVMDERYTEFTQRGENLYTQYESYINELEVKGNSDLAALTQQLINFRNTKETEFLEWFEVIKDIFSTDASGEMLLQIEELNKQVKEIEKMLFTGMVRAELATSNGDTIIDGMGNTIMVRRPICQCAK